MIEIKNLTKRYGQIPAVNDISLTIKKGEILDFHIKQNEPYSYFYTEEKMKNAKPHKLLWLFDNWVQSPDSKYWYPENEIMPEPLQESKLIESIEEIPFKFEYLQNIDEFKTLLEKVEQGIDFHMGIINYYNQHAIYSFNIWQKDNDLIRIYTEITKDGYNYEIDTIFDITISKHKFITEFKQTLKNLENILNT